MNLSEMKMLRPETVEVHVRSGELPPLGPDEEVTLEFGDASALVMVRSAHGCAAVEAVNAAHRNTLWDLHHQGLRVVTQVAADLPGEPRRLSLLTFGFLSRYTWPDLSLSLPPPVRDASVPRKARDSAQAATAWFRRECRSGGEQGRGRFLVTRIPGRHHERTAFRILGEKYAFDIREDDQGRLGVARVLRASRREPLADSPILLVDAEFALVAPGEASPVRALQWEELDASLGIQQEYLQLWEQYNDLDLQLTLADATAFGTLRYDGVRTTPSGALRLILKRGQRTEDQLKELEHDLGRYQVDLSEHAPPSQYLKEASGVLTDDARRWARETRSWTGRVMEVDAVNLTLVVEGVRQGQRAAVPPRGVVYPTVSGDLRQMERRRRAHDDIRRGESGMKGLYKLLEGQHPAARRGTRLEVRDDLVRDVFGGDPTPSQRDALLAALNTPDIALIQGPPGTGKTRVIAALQKLIAHHHEVGGGQSTRARTLITSGQHEAVENVVGAIEVYGLPAVKVGKGQKQTVEPSAEHIERWRLDRADDIRASLTARGSGVRGVERAIQDIQAHLQGYIGSRHVHELPLDLIRQTLETARPFLDAATVDDVQAHLARVGGARPAAAQDEELEDAVIALRRLRTTPAAFEDDGSRQARAALRELAPLQVATQAELQLLERAAQAADDPAAADLPALGELRDALLTRLTSGQGLPEHTVHYGEVDVVRRILHTLTRRAEVEEATVDGALQRYHDDLTHDAEGLRQAVENYTMVLASTCQQSVSGEMFERKEHDNTFSTVIVDEAAHVNPLDLLIPMSLATQNIVLVGDHRQLPHLLEPEVERQLQGEELGTVLKLSLFERLYTSLKALQDRDRILRVVTLADQYRMHPTLGHFLSETFYAPYGEGFDSPRPASDFVQSLPGYAGRCAAWLDVPHTAGGERRRGTSYARPEEARRIAQEVARLFQWMRDHDEWYSVGIIAFYSAQEPELWDALIDAGVAERDAHGQPGPRDAYRTIQGANGRRKEGVRVGTVDAFQGKEFDVVFVSVTRSNVVDPKDAVGIRRKYGHLVLTNRLCVAMSRQQRLLVFSGDRAMVTPEVPALQAFAELARAEADRVPA